MPQAAYHSFKSRTQKAFSVVAALTVVLTSFPVLLGLNHNDPFLAWQIMPFNTALALLCIGLSLLASTFNRKTESLALATFVAALGSATLFEHISQTNLGIDQFFVSAEHTANHEFPGRMSLLSTIALILLSATIFLKRFTSGKLLTVASLFAGTAASIGLLSPFGSQLSAQFDIAAAVNMSKASGTGIAIASITLLSWILLRLRADSEERFRVAPILVTNVLTFVLLLGWQYSLKQHENSVRAKVQLEANQAGKVFGERLSQTKMAIGRYASRIAVLGIGNEAYLSLDSANYTQQLTSIRRIGITDSNFNVIWSFPKSQRSQVSGFNQASDPTRRQTFESARDSRQPVLSPFLKLKSGETGSLVSAPIYNGSKFKGTAYATLAVDLLFNDFTSPANFDLTVSQGEQVIYERHAPSSLAIGLKLQQHFKDGFAEWQISTTPTQDYAKSLVRGVSTWLLVVGEALILLLSVLITHISKERQMRRQLHQREQVSFRRLNNALESGKMAAFSFDFETRKIWRSQNNDELFGYTSPIQDWTIKHVLNCLRPEDVDDFLARQNIAFNSPDLSVQEIRIRRADDQSNRWLRITSMTTFDENGNAVFCEGVLTDITSERAVAVELSTAYSRLQRLIESSGEGIWERNYDTGEVTYLDDASRILLGLERDQTASLAEVNSRLFTEDRIRINQIIEEHVANKTPGFVCDFRIKDARNPGIVKWARGRGQVIVHADGSKKLVSTLRDVSEEVATRRQLELAVTTAQEAVRAKASFLASMSHEIRTPLNGLLGMTDLILETELNATQRTYAQIAQQSGASLLTLINDVLDFSKIEAGKLELSSAQLNIASVVETQIEILTARARDKGLSVASFIAPDVPEFVIGDADRLGQVLLNLVGNAIKFTKSGGVIVSVEKRSTDHASQTLHVRVRDTGIGISAEACAKLFSPFVQADAGISKTYGGTGLGLSISKKIIDTMGGAIGIESVIGAGSTFWFSIPLNAVSEAAKPRKVGWENLIDARVLLIEKDPIVCESLRSYLVAFKMRGEVCASIDEAALKINSAHATSDGFKLLIVGQTGVDGAQLDSVERLRTKLNCPTPHCVLLAEFGAHEDSATLMTAGYRSFVNKPVKQSPLLGALVSAFNVEESQVEFASPSTAVSKATDSTVSHDFKILIADDVPVNLLLTQKTLEFLGYSSKTVSNGQEVLDILEREEFDLILMDCQMPVMDGFEATRAIRNSSNKRIQKMPIIALTANAVGGDNQLCIDAGMNDYISKPMKKEKLAEKLTRWLPAVSTRKTA